jgi:hypothetical protein
MKDNDCPSLLSYIVIQSTMRFLNNFVHSPWSLSLMPRGRQLYNDNSNHHFSHALSYQTTIVLEREGRR